MHPAIPKIIHYVWVGEKPLTPLARRCIESWKVHAPEYTLRFWHNDNIPREHPYVQEMYRRKKWAFVSDYVRFWALEREGGVYLDTDMELLRPLDDALVTPVVLGRSKSGHVESSIIAAPPLHPAISVMRAWYDADTTFSTHMTSPRVIAAILAAHPHSDVTVHGFEYFHPCDEGEKCPSEILTRAYARHHWAESWVPFARVRKVARRLGLHTAWRALRTFVQR